MTFPTAATMKLNCEMQPFEESTLFKRFKKNVVKCWYCVLVPLLDWKPEEKSCCLPLVDREQPYINRKPLLTGTSGAKFKDFN